MTREWVTVTHMSLPPSTHSGIYHPSPQPSQPFYFYMILLIARILNVFHLLALWFLSPASTKPIHERFLRHWTLQMNNKCAKFWFCSIFLENFSHNIHSLCNPPNFAQTLNVSFVTELNWNRKITGKSPMGIKNYLNYYHPNFSSMCCGTIKPNFNAVAKKWPYTRCVH